VEMKVTVRFNTTEFEFSHGRRPRGFSYWGFFFGDAKRTENVWFVPNVCNFADAKKAAREEAKRRDCGEVHVAP
jgi:hypothetical protein